MYVVYVYVGLVIVVIECVLASFSASLVKFTSVYGGYSIQLSNWRHLRNKKKKNVSNCSLTL